jgi:hypothetical protein
MSGTFEEIEFDEFDTDNSKNKKKPDDIAGTFIGLLSMTNLRLFFIVFLLFIFVSSDVFIDQVLGRFEDAREHNCATTKGVIIQATIMVLLVMVMDVFISLI